MLDDDWLPYLNEDKVTPYFENNIIKELYLSGDYKKAKYYGVFSHKFFNKHRKDGRSLKRAMVVDDYGHDVYSFFRTKQFKGTAKKNTFFDTYHSNLLEVGREIIKTLFNERIETIKADRIYYNHWLAKKKVFAGYCKEMLLPAMELMEGDLKDLVYTDATYKAGRAMSGELMGVMSPEQCEAAWGLPYYTHHAFVLERLPSIYFALKGHAIKQL